MSAYAHYLSVREWARSLSDVPQASLTDAERQASEALAPLWDADPGTVSNLRRWCTALGGDDAARYDDDSSPLAKNLRRDLKRLSMQVGRDLFVAEPAILGGFGFGTGADRCNADTLRFFNVLVALDDGAVLRGSLHDRGRRLVWEAAGGWGGFAYQFKTVCPQVTYLITSRPESLLLSAVYLMTAFPQARVRFFDSKSVEGLWDHWEEIDFIFVPESALPALKPPRLDLMLDVLSLRQMSEERVHCHVQRAFDWGCRYVYSLFNSDWAIHGMPSTWKAIRRLYWPHPMPARIELRKTAVDYSHLIGWRRLLA